MTPYFAAVCDEAGSVCHVIDKLVYNCMRCVVAWPHLCSGAWAQISQNVTAAGWRVKCQGQSRAGRTCSIMVAETLNVMAWYGSTVVRSKPYGALSAIMLGSDASQMPDNAK